MKFVRDNVGYLLLIAVFPGLASVGFLFMILAGSDSSRLSTVGYVLLILSFWLLLPLGVLCLFLSWRLSRGKDADPTDFHNLIEFLLGASGLMMVSLGAILLPYTYHMSRWMIE